MEKIFCKVCGWSVTGNEAESTLAAFNKHNLDVHTSPIAQHTALLGTCFVFLSSYAKGLRTNVSKVEAERIANRIAELSPEAVAQPQPLEPKPLEIPTGKPPIRVRHGKPPDNLEDIVAKEAEGESKE